MRKNVTKNAKFYLNYVDDDYILFITDSYVIYIFPEIR